MNIEPRRIAPLHAALSVCALLAALIGASVWAERQGGTTFLPHGFCFTWIPSLLWLHVISDALIAIAYFSIPAGLWYFARQRTDLPFNWIFLLFGTFIIACGLTHLLGIWNVWVPDYWLSGAMKALTAAASLPTAAALFLLIPRALALPTTGQLHAARDALEQEVAMRRAVEQQLREAQKVLEHRVEARTRELADATAQAQAARADAEAANRMKDVFLAKVSHELRTPLQATLSWSRVALTGQLSETDLRRALVRIDRNVQTQARMIEDLLDQSRILAGKLRLELQPTEIAQVLANAVAVVRPLAEEKGVTLETGSEVPNSFVLTDGPRLEQVVWNLLTNAVKYSHPGGTVRTFVRQQSDRLTIRIEDEGQGIAANFLPHVFEPFRQQEGAEKSGLGLGLAIVRSISEQLGGVVTAASDGVDRGATFTVSLPVVNAEPAPPADGAISRRPALSLAGVRILYVEDQLDVADAEATMLARHGAHVLKAHSVERALDLAKSTPIDVLLSDIGLGTRTGIDLLTELRSWPALKNLPAIAVSAYGAQADLEASHRAGFSAHLVKPIDTAVVVETIVSVLRRV